MNKIIFFVLFAAIFIFLATSKVYAEDGYLQCYEECNTDIEKKQRVRSYIYHNASPSELWSERIIYKTVHIVNLKTGGVNSYKATIVQPEYDTDDVVVRVSEISASSIVKNEIKPAYEAFSTLNRAVKQVIIPESVVANAWNFVNCAYCENSINDFVSSTLQGKLVTVAETISTVTEILGLTNTAIPNVHRIKLETGGYVEVKLALLAHPLALALTVQKAVDNNDNTVPLNASGLNNLKVKVVRLQDVININNKIRDFNFGAPVRIGVATIRDCVPNPDNTGKLGRVPC